MSIKQYKIAPMLDGSLNGSERLTAIQKEWEKWERPSRIYGKRAGGTVGFNSTGDILTVDTSGARKFWNVHSEIIESDLDVLKALLAQDFKNNGQWNGYKNPILQGKSGKINGNQAIPNTWTEI